LEVKQGAAAVHSAIGAICIHFQCSLFQNPDMTAIST